MTFGHTCTQLLTVCLLVAACSPGEADSRVVGAGDGIEHGERVCDVVLEAGERLSNLRGDPSTYDVLRSEPERWVEMWREQASLLSTLEDEVPGSQIGHLAAALDAIRELESSDGARSTSDARIRDLTTLVKALTGHCY